MKYHRYETKSTPAVSNFAGDETIKSGHSQFNSFDRVNQSGGH